MFYRVCELRMSSSFFALRRQIRDFAFRQQNASFKVPKFRREMLARYYVNTPISALNICCGYSLEAPLLSAYSEYPQPRFSMRNKTAIYGHLL